jgi:hypothetical protein
MMIPQSGNPVKKRKEKQFISSIIGKCYFINNKIIIKISLGALIHII